MNRLPLKNYHSYEHYVANLDRAVAFYTNVLGYKIIGRNSTVAQEQDGMERLVLTAGPTINLILSAPKKDFSVAAKYLQRHPEGIAFLNFRAQPFSQAVSHLKEKKATLFFESQTSKDQHGEFRQVAFATPLDDVSFRLIDDSQYQGFAPNFVMDEMPGKYLAPSGFECIDHVTINVKTLQPLLAFYRDVLGFEEFWNIEFHTNDVNPKLPVGSGLKSTVMWHPDSGIKFANNEPAYPFFRNSQIDIYLTDNRGSGIQHLALRVPNIIKTMQGLKGKDAQFLAAPGSYYDRVPARLEQAGFKGRIKEAMAELSKLDILIDGSSKGYLLQIFSHELSRQFKDPQGGALFYEIIQREGDDGFGGGNFRALFETIELDQIAMAKTASQLPLELL